MDKFGKICRHHWKERLNVSNIAKFESDTSSASEDIGPQSWYGGGHKLALHHTNVCKISRIEELYLR